MRTRILSLICGVLLAVTATAQPHLSFKGIPITGSMTSFCQQLKTKGFTQISSDNNITTFVGDFTGRQAYVAVGAADDGKNVHSVVVLFDPSEEWNTLVNTYDYYKEIYSRKYGNPAKSIEKNPSNSNSNISLMYELWQGRVVYGSLWEVEGGSIEISIEKSSEGINEGIVVIKYRDSQNIETKIQKDLEDI